MSQQVISKATSLCGDITQNITSDKLKALEDRAQLFCMDAPNDMWSQSDLHHQEHQLVRHQHQHHRHQHRHRLLGFLDYDMDTDYCMSLNPHNLGPADIDRCNQHLKLDEIILLSTSNLKYASCVFLNNCKIGDKGCEILAGGLADCTSLKHLALSANAISDVGAEHLAKVSIALQSLDLSYNRIGDPGAIVLAESLQNLPGLEALDLRCNLIGDEGAITLAKSIKIPKLRIWNYKISQSGADSIHSHNPAVDEPFGILILNYKIISNVERSILANNIQESPEKSNIIIIVLIGYMLSNKDSIKIIEHCHNLQSLTIHLSYPTDPTDRIKALADGLKHCTSLQTLNLSRSRIGDDGIKALAEGLKHCTSLQTLNLSDNCIVDVKALADGLKNCTSLQRLDLSDNSIGNDGVKALVDQLKHCTSLQTLDLSRSRMGDDGIKALAEGLKHCTSLQTLDLSDNCIVDVKALADGLKNCTSLQTLNLSDNSIGNDGVKALADQLKHCTSLQTLDLSDNIINCGVGIEALADGLKHCTNLQTLNLLGNNMGNAP